MCDPITITTVAVAAVSAYSSYQQGQAAMSSAKAQAEALRKQGEVTVQRAEKQGELVEDAAKYEGKQQAVKSALLSSSQRAALAANGVDLGSVSAQDITLDSASKSQEDANAIRYNADMKAYAINEDAKFKNWSLNYEADSAIFQGKQARKQANIQAGVSLLGAAASVANGAMLASTAARGTTMGAGVTSQGISVPTRFVPAY